MLNNPQSLEYFVSEKQAFLVVSFLGSMTKLTSRVLEKCQSEILQSEAKRFVLSFHDVTQLEPSAIPFLVRMQKALRDKGAEIRVCFLKPEFKKLLIEAAAVRTPEVMANLIEALQSFKKE